MEIHDGVEMAAEGGRDAVHGAVDARRLAQRLPERVVLEVSPDAEAHVAAGVADDVDSRELDGDYHVYQNTGDPDKTTAAQRLTTDWIREAQDRGAGEVVLNCMNQDGVRKGYDTAQLRTIRDVCSVPLIASGGAGAIEHFRDVFRIADVDGALAASVFHSAEIDIRDLKSWLADQGIAVRPRGDKRDH